MAKRNPELVGDRCSTCNGDGTVLVDAGGFYIQAECGVCRGTGLVNSPNACKECKGSGSILADFGGIKIEARCGHCNGSGLEPVTE